MYYRRKRDIIAAVAVTVCGVCLWSVPVSACGPFFPETILDAADKVLLEAPVADFLAEIAHITPPLSTRSKYPGHGQSTNPSGPVL